MRIFAHFGTYHATADDLRSYAAVGAFVVFTSFLIASSLFSNALLIATIVTATVIAATFAIVLEAKSVRILSPEEIAFRSPFSRLSWSVPFADVQRFELERGRPHHRLRVFTARRSYSMPLTAEMWRALGEGQPSK